MFHIFWNTIKWLSEENHEETTFPFEELIMLMGRTESTYAFKSAFRNSLKKKARWT